LFDHALNSKKTRICKTSNKYINDTSKAMAMKKDLILIYSVQKEVTLLGGVMALLDWDEKTHMPARGIEARSEQMKMISDLMHQKMVSDELYSSLKTLRKEKLSLKDSIVVRELYKDVTKIRRLPREFVQLLTKETVLASQVWEKAKKKNDFSLFKPQLAKMVALMRKEAKYLHPNLKPYDGLLDENEEGMTSERLTKLFEPLKSELILLLNKIKASPEYKKQKEITVKMPIDEQKELILAMQSKMGVTSDVAQLDKSTHPFMTRISEHDVRMTTRYKKPLDAFLSSVHEGGHALYELNLPTQYTNTVIHSVPSTGIHESQSRIWENNIARSFAFWKGQKGFPTNLFRSANMVHPSFIRTESDEVTYCLHIILRYEIERDLINGTLSVDDAKAEWNKKFFTMFGIMPKSDNDGILQDTHWAIGAYGYFPCYAIGSIYASQLYMQMRKELPMDKLVAHQDFAPISKWLKEKVHSKGRTMLADEIIKKACGKGLDPEVFVKYLNEKYSKIYSI